MCGIAGIWNHKSRRPVDRGRVEAITQLIAHRGPDGHGYYWQADLGLGHRRLSIIDLEGGRQPMTNEDGTLWIVFNGEIYNYPELRRELEGRHAFRTNSDTEAILHLYEEHGERCFEKLAGMFAIALWDGRNERLLLARDRLGIKPLFYGLGPEAIAFGSELKCVRESGVVNLAVDPTAIADLFTCYYIPGPKTIYLNACSLEPGHYLVVSRAGARKGCYWDLTGEELRLPSERDYEERLYGILHDSVRGHLLSDVPIGAFLSGGVDSSVVVGLMAGLVREPIMTCSIGFPVEEYNELERARAVARRFRTDHHEQVVTPEPAKLLERLADYYDQPFPDHSSIPTYYVSRLARERVKVVLSGDGGDENFAGYGRYARHLALELIRRRIPKPLRGLLLHPFGHWYAARENGQLFARLRRVTHQLAIGAREGYLHAMTFGDAPLRAKLLSPELLRELRGYEPLDIFRRIYDRAPGANPLSKIFYLDLKTWLVDDILTKVDRASMANSLEVRVPLLDHRVVEFAYSLPLAFKLRDGSRKYLLRKVMTPHLPSEHLNMPKKGFSIPIAPWMRGELRDWAHEHIFASPDATPYLNLRGVEHVWNAFQRGGTHLVDMLSILLSFGLSARLWTRAGETVAPGAD